VDEYKPLTVGTSIFLDLVSRQSHPTAGRIRVPPARMDRVSKSDMGAFFNSTLRENLTYGHPRPEVVPDAVIADMIRSVGMGVRVTRYPLSIWRITLSIRSSPISLDRIPYRYPG